MGTCLSCCEDEHSHTTPNGHAGQQPSHQSPAQQHPSPPSSSSPPLKPPPQVITPPLRPDSLTAVQEPALEPVVPFSAPAPASAAGAASATAATAGNDKWMFAPYSKLPPIRKTSSGGSNGGEPARKAASATPSRDFAEQKIHALFEQYRDPEEDAILADGIERLCHDLDVRPEEFKVLVLAWKFNAQQMCYFSRQEMLDGCRKLRVDSVRGIRARFADLLREVEERATFKELYRWTYKFGLESDQRTLPTDVAVVLWKLVFFQNEPRILGRWLDFLSTHPSIRGIPKDTWDMFLNFTEAVGDDLSSYDDTEAWPSLFDDFVEYENDRQNQNVSDKEIKTVSEDL